jgi:hypothetical protein
MFSYRRADVGLHLRCLLQQDLAAAQAAGTSATRFRLAALSWYATSTSRMALSSTGWAHCRAVYGWCRWPVRLYKVLPGREPVDLESPEALALGGEDAGGGACLDWELFIVTRSSFFSSLLLHSNFHSLHWWCYLVYIYTVGYWTRQVEFVLR